MLGVSLGQSPAVQTGVGVAEINKHASLLLGGINYSCKMFCSLGPREISLHIF
jgi:hypothetical protein